MSGQDRPNPVASTTLPQELETLLARVARGDQDAFAELYRRTASRLLGVCTRMIADRREAEEVLQEAFINVWQRADRFDPARANASTWLLALTRNKAIDRLRQQPAAARVDDIEMESLADDAPNPLLRAQDQQDYHRLQQCLQALEANQRRSIEAAFLGGLSYSALAQRANVPLGTMKSWIRRGLLQLRECLSA